MIASDIHGSEYYCKKMLGCLEKEQADRLILLGDILYHGPRNDLPKEYCPKAVIALLNQQKDKILCVRGNCEAEVDQMVLEFPVMADYAIIFCGSRMMFVTHGHLFNENNLPPMNKGDILLHGHTHILAAENRESYVYLNPGSVSIPKNGNVPSYMIYEDDCFTIKDLEGSVLKQLSLKNNNLTEDINNLVKEPFPDKSTIDAFTKFCRIVRTLRAPNGCPWDRVQTHESLKTCLIEEAYEVVEAIQRFSDTNDAANLKEELGDVLLQVILHGQIASEEGIFELKDIIDEISKKMIRRHPHVFGTKAVDDASQVVINWEEIKRQEKKENGLQYENELEMIPKAFPALIRAQKVLKKSEIAKNSSIEQLCITAKEKITKLQCDNNQKDLDIEEIIGTLLLDVTNLAMQYNKNSEQLLAQSVQKLIDKSKES